MNDNEKLEAFLKELAIVFHINDEFIAFIRENIVLRANYYKDIKINFENETTYINNSSSTMDFFINRLIHNVRHYEYSNVYNPNNVESEDYNYETQTFKLPSLKAIGDIAVKKLQNRMDEVPKETAELVNKKIISHEFGHVFQTCFNGIVGDKDNKYKELITNLNNKYPNTFIIPFYEQKLIIEQNGLIPTLVEDGKNGIREYYYKKDRIILFDDIFNEDESLQIFHIDKIQSKYDLGHDCYKNIYNYESINFKITTYARMMKQILGTNKSFRIMYQNGIEFYEFFDQFENYATEIFKNGNESKKPVVSCILDSLERIKKNNSLRDALNLDLFFAKCLEGRVKFLLKQKVTPEDIMTIKKIVNDFITYSTRCTSGKLDHQYVIDNIKKMLDKYK